MTKATKEKKQTSGVFELYHPGDKQERKYTGASKRIEICVRDYKKFLVDGRASKKLVALVEAIAGDLKAPFEQVVNKLEYRVVEEAKADEVQEVKDKYVKPEPMLRAAQQPKANKTRKKK